MFNVLYFIATQYEEPHETETSHANSGPTNMKLEGQALLNTNPEHPDTPDEHAFQETKIKTEPMSSEDFIMGMPGNVSNFPGFEAMGSIPKNTQPVKGPGRIETGQFISNAKKVIPIPWDQLKFQKPSNPKYIVKIKSIATKERDIDTSNAFGITSATPGGDPSIFQTFAKNSSHTIGNNAAGGIRIKNEPMGCVDSTVATNSSELASNHNAGGGSHMNSIEELVSATGLVVAKKGLVDVGISQEVVQSAIDRSAMNTGNMKCTLFRKQSKTVLVRVKKPYLKSAGKKTEPMKKVGEKVTEKLTDRLEYRELEAKGVKTDGVKVEHGADDPDGSHDLEMSGDLDLEMSADLEKLSEEKEITTVCPLCPDVKLVAKHKWGKVCISLPSVGAFA